MPCCGECFAATRAAGSYFYLTVELVAEIHQQGYSDVIVVREFVWKVPVCVFMPCHLFPLFLRQTRRLGSHSGRGRASFFAARSSLRLCQLPFKKPPLPQPSSEFRWTNGTSFNPSSNSRMGAEKIAADAARESLLISSAAGFHERSY
jgi:hypothetical protein